MVVAWRKFIDEYGKDWILKSIEEPIANETHGFAGTPDRIVWNKEKKRYAVVEIKTGAAAQWHRLQTAAYKFLFSTSQLAVEEQANGPVDRIAVYLKSDGTFSVEQHDYPLQRCRDKDIFLAALACTNWRIKHGAFFKKEN